MCIPRKSDFVNYFYEENTCVLYIYDMRYDI